MAESAAEIREPRPQASPGGQPPHLREVGKETQAEAGPARPAATAAPARRGRGRLRGILFALLPVALVAGGILYVTGGRVMSTEDAYVQADMVGVSTDVSGIVKSVAVHDNEPVKAGQLLFSLDEEPFRLALDRTDAELGTVRNDISAMKAEYRDMEAQIQQENVEIDYFQREFDRQAALIGRGAATQASYDQAQRNLLGAKQKLASLRQQQKRIAANLGHDPDIRIEDHPKYKEVLARRDEAARQLAHTRVYAPMDGIATNVPSLQPGQYLAASTAAFSVVSQEHVWVQAMPKETELTWVRPGQDVAVSVDTYPDETWHGTVESIAPASGASFSLLPAQNTSGNWVKVVQRIAMRVRIDTPRDKPPLRVGMSVVVDVDTGHARGLPTSIARLFDRFTPWGHAAAAPAPAG